MNDEAVPPVLLARNLMRAGVVLGSASLLAWACGAFLTPLGVQVIPDSWIALGVYKLTLASAGGLVVAGAALKRSFSRRRPAHPERLGEGAAPDFSAANSGERVAAKRERDR